MTTTTVTTITRHLAVDVPATDPMPADFTGSELLDIAL